MIQNARTVMTEPGRAKVGVSSYMPLQRFEMALAALGCEVESIEPAPDDTLLMGPTLTISGPFATASECRWMVSDAKILAHRQSLGLTCDADEGIGIAA